ncbi:hypothetical protein I6A84_01225 [Frankia sp. CNm7]|uniref:Uncharacterized protein n=1 Tax=Frankia nepalensis TaxID=1836974 RepID=A0A937RLR9_9ACTN|nr:hypothetical protein [Frankia nepalensis]MBL7496121.1 hypothetical protein [Frankia nepalensis]MBL7508940.1 hypothetical protein [Frankia nepalensis]MBL7516780.1 hypothetical protein [Frankia nepalensis]MBL7628718.1 hypothetical protein [Frankia nepalensis]
MNVYDVAARLPDIPPLRDHCRALAMLDAIVCPEWQFRYYSFDATWSPGEDMASMRDGSGDAYSIVFGPAGAFIRGFAHESPMSPARTGDLWPGLVDAVPDAFHAHVTEPAFSYNGRLEATFVLWRQPHDKRWQTGTIDLPPHGGHGTSPDGAELLVPLCDPSPNTYLDFATDYHEVTLDTAAVRHIWALRPLDDATVTALNPDLTLADIRSDAEQIGYPVTH